MTQALIGKTLNRYKILQLLGQGGMGAVYKGHDATLQRDVAIKVMHAHFAQEPNFRDRFLLEARTAARLDHPGIVKVYDFGEQEGLLYIVMEYIAGEDLFQKLEQAKKNRQWLPLYEAVVIGQQIAAALDYAHKQGILHRDIKPSNIMLKPEASSGLPFRPVLTDLGLAQLAVGQNLTEDGTSVGTPAYLSPEQANGEKADSRSDVYSFGVLLFELVTGKPPFKIQTLPEAIRYHSSVPPPPPRDKRPSIPENLEQVILKALEKDPRKRFTDAGTIALALERIAAWLAQNPISTPTSGPPPSPPPAGRGQPPPRPQSAMAPPGSISRGAAPISMPPKAVKVDSLYIESTHQPPQTVPINKPELIMGRSKTADIPLNSLGVSREHARVSFDGKHYYLIDMNSINGTLMDNVPLLPGVPEFWNPDKQVTIGAYTIHLVRAGKATPLVKDDRVVSQIFLLDGNPADPRNIYTSKGDGRIEATLEKDELEVNPGEVIGTTIHLVNQGATVDHFQVTVEGVPPKWVTVSPSGLNLMPGDQGSLQIQFKPPRDTASKAGIYDLVMRVSSRDDPQQFVEIVGCLTVFSYLEFVSDLHPPKVSAGQRTRVTIRNLGNSTETFVLNLKSQADDLTFTPPGIQIDIEEGKPGAIEFFAKPKTFRWMRRKQSHPFSAELGVASGDEKRNYMGEVVSNGLIPLWLPPLMLLMCLAMAVAIPAGYMYLTQATPTPTAVPVAVVEEEATATLAVLPFETPGQATGGQGEPDNTELTPSPTPDFCPGAPPRHIKKGDTVIVVTDDEALYVRSAPIIRDGNIIAQLQPGTELQVVRTEDSPVCYTINEEQNQRVVFWMIRANDITFNDGSKMGWVVEGDNLEYYIDPK